ncbi:MAG: Uma2 family endonuclease [Prochloron sp. SP5CPC1]|nr:Uma2 family endonuclease [Candidatus Paraprochloron terpiosi SP5CPC1]
MVTTIAKPKTKTVSLSTIIPLRGVSWSTYQALMREVGENRLWRIAYDRGVLEIQMPLLQHEEPKRLLESLIEAIVDELEIELRSLGSLILERPDLKRAIEPDSCFYIQNEARVRGKDEINLAVDPPPDLAIESDYTNSSLNKFTIYGSLGIKELWRYSEGSLEVYLLKESGEYEKTDQSLVFPFLPLREVPEFMEQSKTQGQRKAVGLFKERIRALYLGGVSPRGRAQRV